MKNASKWYAGAALWILAAAPTCAQSQDVPAGESRAAQLEEVVVTAEKRSANLQDVPATISAIGAEDLQNSGRQSLSDITGLVPGLTFTSSTSGNFIFVRGVGQAQANAGIESPVATYIDGVYLFSTQSAMMSFNDIERIEVLKGPQGTLFGRNATGGVVHVITKDPSSTPSGQAEIGYGNYDTVEGRFYGTTGIGENWAVSLALYGKKRMDGFGRNLTTGNETFLETRLSAHGKILYTSPGGATRVTASVLHDYSRTPDITLSIDPGYRAADFTTNVGRFNTTGRIDSYPANEQTLFYMKLEQDLGWARFVGLASQSVLDFKGFFNANISGANRNPVTGLVVPVGYQHTTISGDGRTAELQLQSPEGEDFRWVTGVYFLKDTTKSFIVQYVNDNRASNLQSKLITKSASIFAQATKTILPRLELTLGARYTEDRHSIEGLNSVAPFTPVSGGIPTSIKEAKPTYRISGAYHFNDSVMGYASYNTGFRSGRYVNNNFANPPVLPETIDALEIGFKSELFDRRLRVNASAFSYEYNNLQVRAPNSNGVSRTLNAATAKGQGVDLDFDAVLGSRLRLSGGVEYLEAEFSKFPRASCPSYNPVTAAINVNVICDLSGTRLINAPKWSGAIRLTYTQPVGNGELQFTAEDQYSSSFNFEPDGRLIQPSYHNVRASISWTPENERWYARLWATNLLNEQVYRTRGTSSSMVYISGNPTLYGLTLGANF